MVVDSSGVEEDTVSRMNYGSAKVCCPLYDAVPKLNLSHPNMMISFGMVYLHESFDTIF